MIFITLTIWYIFASLSGAIEAILYSKKGAEAFKWNEHILYFIQRGSVVAGIYFGSYLNLNLNQWGLLLLSCGFSYSFFHDGFYYFTRSKIDFPSYKFTSNSKTSTAIIKLPFIARLAMFIFSFLLIVAIFEI